MPELLWTDAHHEAPTLPPPRGPLSSSTRVEVPKPNAVSTGASATKLEIPRSHGRKRVGPPPLPGRRGATLRKPLPPPKRFDPKASAALPLVRKIDFEMDPIVRVSGRGMAVSPTEARAWSAESSTTMQIRESRGVAIMKPLDKICILMTQALPLVRVNHSERLERRAVAERAAIVVVGCAALVMTMLAVASAMARLVS